MNKSTQIAFHKRQIDTARTMKSAGAQIIAEATLLESEAKRALELLGGNSGRTSRGKSVLTPAQKLKLIGGLTPQQ